MSALPQLPAGIQKLGTHESFTFECRPENSCFTGCCRKLELALSPYDVLRLCKATELSSDQFLDQYVIVEKEEADVFPRLYLTMIDDGEESCAFISKTGCRVYAHRPGACRMYPLGRAVTLKNDSFSEFFVLLKEPHCLGFVNNTQQTSKKYIQDQGLGPYNIFNDSLAAILQHEKIRAGMTLSKNQYDSFILALYNIDQFSEQLISGQLQPIHSADIIDISTWAKQTILLYGIKWLTHHLFNG